MSIFDSFIPKKPVMNVCMMGPKAVGKTTVLTAVFNETQQQISDTTLNLKAKGDTLTELLDRQRMLQSVFAQQKDITDNGVANAGIAATSVESKFEFEMGHLGKPSIIDLVIKDFPGEMVVDRQEDVVAFIKDSQCVLIAIDTPHLMELDGQYNDVKNKPELVTSLFKNATDALEMEKLVLFVPLKCEKYFHEGRMKEVLEKVEATYAELINHFASTQKVCCCVTPILTLGGVEFDSFSYSEGELSLAPDGCPANVRYKYAGDKKYNPLFCSQPLYSLLLFVAAQYKRNEARKSLLDRLIKTVFDIFDSDETLFDEVLKMSRVRIANNERLGYKPLCGNHLFSF